MDIAKTLLELDATNDDHWTTDGLPRVEVISELAGIPVTRKQITDAAPGLTRQRLATGDVAGEHAEQVEAEVAEEPTPDLWKEPSGRPMVREADLSPKQAATVVIEDDVVAMPPARVMESVELIDRALAEFARQHGELVARRDAILEKIRDVGRRTELLQRQRDLLSRGSTDSHRANVLAYQESSRKAREERAARAQRFIDAGTTASDVAAQLSGASRLDSAMRARKPARGSGRPQMAPVNP